MDIHKNSRWYPLMIIHYDKLKLMAATTPTTPTTSSLKHKMSFQKQCLQLTIAYLGRVVHRTLTPSLTSLVSLIGTHLVHAVNTVSHSSVEVRSLKSRLLVRNNKRVLQISPALPGRPTIRGKRNCQTEDVKWGGKVPDLLSDSRWCISWCSSQTLTRF